MKPSMASVDTRGRTVKDGRDTSSSDRRDENSSKLQSAMQGKHGSRCERTGGRLEDEEWNEKEMNG